jgi:hypothetical protein
MPTHWHQDWRSWTAALLLLGVAATFAWWFTAAEERNPSPRRDVPPPVTAGSPAASPIDTPELRRAAVATEPGALIGGVTAAAATAGPATLSVRGVVEDATTRAPVARASIRLHLDASALVGDPAPIEATSDERGRFTFGRFPLAVLNTIGTNGVPVLVQAQGYHARVANLLLRAAPDGGELEPALLQAAASHGVVVVDEKDQPVAGVRIHALVTGAGSTPTLRTNAPDGMTDPSGTATVWLRDAGPGRLALGAEKVGWTTARAPVASPGPTRIVLRAATPLTVELREVPAGAAPEFTVGGTSVGAAIRAVVPVGAEEHVVPDPRVDSRGRAEVRAEWADATGVYSTATHIDGDARRCTLTFARTSAPIAVHWPTGLEDELTIGVFVRKFGQGPVTYRSVLTARGEAAEAAALPRIVGDVFAAAWSPRVGYLRARAPCRHDDASGLHLEPHAHETIACRAHVLGDDGNALRGRLELRAALPLHWTFDTGTPTTMRVRADAPDASGVDLGLLPKTYVEGVLVGEDGRPRRVARTAIGADVVLRTTGW